jgi:protein phosphatase
MKFVISSACDVGCLRSNNEDKVMLPGIIFTDDRYDLTFETDKCVAFAVADGMGGHNAGEVASRIVLEELDFFIKNIDPGFSPESLNHAINQWAKQVHLKLQQLGGQRAEYSGMGTTLVGLLYYFGRIFWFNAGDSRLYRLCNGILRQISRDHSLIEATGNKDLPSNILVNSIGGGARAYVEMEEITAKTFNGDIYLLCSDGLTDMVADENIENLLISRRGVSELLDEAKKNGGRDNISAVIVECLF